MKQLATYRLDYAQLFGGVIPAIMIEILERETKRSGNNLYFFIRPEAHSLYVNGKSWFEMAGLSESDVKYGLGIIGTKLLATDSGEAVLNKNEPEFTVRGSLINSNYLVIYRRVSGVDVYTLNSRFKNRAIEIFERKLWKDSIGAFTKEYRNRDKEETLPKLSLKTFNNEVLFNIELDEDGE